MSKNFAIVSIGTNSTRVLLADVAPDIPRVVSARSIGTRVGEGLDESGRLGDEPMQRTLAAVEQLLRSVRGHYVRLFAVATSAVRRAENGDTFATRVSERLGVALRILSGDEEAAASYRGAITALGARPGERVGVIDVGGGSTEYAVGEGEVLERSASCEIGAVRLTEAEPALAGRDGAVKPASIERARKAARAALAALAEFPAIERLALVGGSATTTGAIARGKPAAAASYPLTRAGLQAILARLCRLNLEQRKAVAGMKAQRADILPAGIIIMDVAFDLLKGDAAIATTSDLLLGILIEQRAAMRTAGHQPPIHAGTQTRKGFQG